jgi:hypothetical protein
MSTVKLVYLGRNQNLGESLGRGTRDPFKLFFVDDHLNISSGGIVLI